MAQALLAVVNLKFNYFWEKCKISKVKICMKDKYLWSHDVKSRTQDVIVQKLQWHSTQCPYNQVQYLVQQFIVNTQFLQCHIKLIKQRRESKY